jgi:Zn-dependent membrane protease YugP
MFFDPTYLVFVALPAILLSLAAQAFVRSAYSKWGKVRNSSGLTGAQVAERILDRTDVRGVQLQGVRGRLTDHYDPESNVVRLSEDIASTPSVAAMAVVAHELGHAQQYQERSTLIGMRSFLVPAVRFSPQIGITMIFIGLLLNASGLLYLGILLFGVMVVFMLLTLPVEFDASFRGLRLLRQAGLMQTPSDQEGASRVLTAAGLTYVAAAIGAILQLVYYLGLANRRR